MAQKVHNGFGHGISPSMRGVGQSRGDEPARAARGTGRVPTKEKSRRVRAVIPTLRSVAAGYDNVDAAAAERMRNTR
ncbi:hypothetical protein GCM10012284_32500 [Mangrovihabitans endophyticus]|uniref:Uncharacterized protein n=1 Tax=Mangrovihabitans endophyticus TaxID=1751298 RepID=A0A8J3FQ74_9ACTN|nr:hypothetical protein GCM10012284_32500 [Mangrovihabitans endophyticus]